MTRYANYKQINNIKGIIIYIVFIFEYIINKKYLQIGSVSMELIYYIWLYINLLMNKISHNNLKCNILKLHFLLFYT